MLGLFLELTGWKTERSPVMKRLERLGKSQGLSIAEVIEELSKVSEEEFKKILLLNSVKTGGIDDKTDFERYKIQSDTVSRLGL